VVTSCKIKKDVVGSLAIVLLQIFSWFWQWNNCENRLIFDEVKAYRKTVPFLSHPVGSVCTLRHNCFADMIFHFAHVQQISHMIIKQCSDPPYRRIKHRHNFGHNLPHRVQSHRIDKSFTNVVIKPVSKLFLTGILQYCVCFLCMFLLCVYSLYAALHSKK